MWCSTYPKWILIKFTGQEGCRPMGGPTPFQFDRVLIDGSDTGDGYGIDNITIGRAPEPSTSLLLALGLTGGV